MKPARLTDSKLCACGCRKRFTRREILKKTNGDKTAFGRRKYWTDQCRLKKQKKFIDSATSVVIAGRERRG